TMNAQEHFQAGNLTEAITAALAEVKRNPGDLGQRNFLCELLCFAGEVERADRQLDTLGHQEPDAMVAVALFRQLLRAEQARQQFYAGGRLPEFLDAPTPVQRLHLEASIRIREGKPAEAAALLGQAEAQRPKVQGTCNGQPFDDLRDLDDLTASFLEVLTSTGKYFWVPMERVELLEFRPAARPRDLLWRRAHLIVKDGPDGEVFLPTLYAGSHTDADERVRLGRATEWRGGQGAPTRGVGQRTFLVGNEGLPIMEMGQLTVNQAAS